ncbi:hypothetical protein G6F56_004383 [Rhizopus delemar]|nr:hypothetical protein G6F56_004383 [Rhizopus delemar]
MLGQYLLLQNCIGEAQDILSSIHLEEATEKHPIQTDYLHAYLKSCTRLSNQEQLLQLDFVPHPPPHKGNTLTLPHPSTYTHFWNSTSIQHANINSVAIAYDEMNIEVMFSENPFMNEAVSRNAFKLIKPTSVEYTKLNEPRSQKGDEEDDFDIIGMAQVQSAHISRVPFKGVNKNMIVEIKTNTFTSDAITTEQKKKKKSWLEWCL